VSEQNVDPELNVLADALAHLKPRPAALDRDALMFRAGRASAPHGWKWRLTTAISTLTAVALGIALLIRPQPPVVERTNTIYVEVIHPAPDAPRPELKPSAPPEAPALVSHEVEASPRTDYERLQDHLLRWGLDGLPSAPHTQQPPRETPESLLHSL
jgi:hypothetical protein